MADDGGNGDEVVVDPKAIDAAATTFQGFGDDLLASINGLAAGTLVAGDFPAAETLTTLVDERTTQLITNVTNLGNAFISISTNLIEIAKEYRETEDKNQGEANRIDDIVFDVNDNLDEPAPEPAADPAA